MARLNPHAFKILDAEVKKCGGNDRLSQIERDIVLLELEKLRSQNGPPASLEELRKIVITTYPNFSEKSLNAAAKANRPASLWGQIKFTALLAVGTFVSLAAVGALLKVPKTAENQVKVLMAVKTEEPKQPNPARMSTEDNYRQGMALVEQGERLIEQGTGSADLTLAEEKLNRAKKHIDRLPVSHYSYDSYRSYKGEWRSYRQKVYEDQFASIRAKVERLQTQLFQEQQAQAQLKEVEEALNMVKAQYQQAQTSEERSAKLASWQAGMDRLKQIPSETLAGKTAQAKLTAYERDFQQSSGIEAAKQFAMEAAKLGQNPPHSAAKWEQIENQWEEAINRLEQITDRESGYIDSQKLLATYQKLGFKTPS